MTSSQNYGPTLQKMVEGIEHTMATYEPLEPTGETTLGILAFAKWYEGNYRDGSPESVLLAYERYQSALARQASEIHWLETSVDTNLRCTLRYATRESTGIIGCELQEAGDSLTLWSRGVIEAMVRWEQAQAHQD